MNDHEDGGVKENYREQDIYLPIANVARIMKNAVPQTGKVCEGQKIITLWAVTSVSAHVPLS